jgi:type I restriction enzyme, S subunit
MSFPPYERCKASGVNGLGDVPGHWAISRLGYEAYVRARLGWKGLRAEEYVDDGFVLLATPNIKGTDIDFDDVNYINEHRYNESPEIMVRVGDVLLAKDGSTLGTVNVVRQLPKPTTVNSSIAVISPGERLQSIFLHYLFRSSYIEQTIQQLKGGMGVPHLFQDDLTRFHLALPPLDEQHTIASFLDRETAKIDALVHEQSRLIGLLKEKRQAVISHAVTRGLGRNAAMKHSGVERLGQVPEHWEVRKLSTLSTKITNGYVGPTRDLFVDEGVRYLQSLHIKDNRITFDPPYYVRKTWSDQHEKSILGTGDVLIVQTGDIGQVAVVSEEYRGCNCHALIVVTPVRTVVSGDWLSWVLNADYGFHSLLSIQTGALHPHLNCGNVKDLFLPVPPLKEQQEIIEALTAQLRKLDDLIAEAERAILLQNERRTTLISAAVTGKIDVRGEASASAEAA